MKDVIIVTVDSLRTDHCGWQSDSELTPNLDRIAGDSVTYESAIAPGPRTLSSVPVSHTGVHFPVTDHDTDYYGERVARIRDHVTQFETISERFREAGYRTIAYTANPWTSADNKFDTGFTHFREVGRDGGSFKKKFSGTFLESPANFFDLWWHKDIWFSQWRTFYQDLTEELSESDDPTFTWVFLLDTHNPYLVPRQDRHKSSTFGMYYGLLKANSIFNQTGGKTLYQDSLSDATLSRIRSAYCDSVRSVDKFVGRLYEDVINDETLFIFHSDHGESFGEHGTYGHEPVVYDENIHVPFLVHNCGSAGSIDATVSTSVLPELTTSCAIDETPLDTNDGDWTSEYAVARTEDSSTIAIRTDSWKLIQDDDDRLLFDLDTDPRERENVYDEHPAIGAELEEKRDEYLSGLPKPKSEANAIDSDEMKNHLQSLGYL